MVLKKDAPVDSGRRGISTMLAQRRRRQGEKIKAWLCQGLGARVISRLLREMHRTRGVQLNVYSLENPAWRQVWEVSFDHEAPWVYSYFYVRRLFAGKEIDLSCDCLGPAWEAPAALLDYSDEDLMQLLSREEIQVVSAAGRRIVQVGKSHWVDQLQDALREGYQHAFCRN
ncbi:MAG: hypothetical protein HY326_10670 [Chloroflexi bacterium]|nr:hypothetical protein [Chloroflexota bacterium]